MLSGFGEIALHQVGFAEVFVRASVPRIEHQRLLIMPHRRIDLPQTAIGVAKIVLNIGIAALLVERAIAEGAIRDDVTAIDLLRAQIGVSYDKAHPDWQASARRLVDIFIDGLRCKTSARPSKPSSAARRRSAIRRLD